MSDAGERAVLEHLGFNALSFLLAVDSDRLRERIEDASSQLSEQQERVLAQLVLMDSSLMPWAPDTDNSAQWVDQLSTAAAAPEGWSVGNLAHVLSGGEILQVDTALGLLEQHLTRLAIDCYPGLLVRESDSPFSFHRSLRALYGHPSNKEFRELARVDRQLGRLFAEESESSGWIGSVLRSTGSGGSIQLWTLADNFINAGWIAASLKDVAPTPHDFVASVLTSLETTRSAIKKQPASVPARVGLAGMLLPESISELELGWARIRRADDRDRPYIRSTGTTEQLTGTNEHGQTTVIHYHGDLVLELDVPYAVDVRELPLGEPWPELLLVSSRATETTVESLRVGLLLALPDRRAVLHTSWQTFADPLSSHRMLGWADLTRAVGLMPTQLTTAQVRRWMEWAELIHTRRTPSISVAVRRMLAAVAERRTPEDILVDAVIVWENLFGAKTETTLRVCSSLAWLLGTSAADRQTRFARYKKIYSFRSAVVHGAASIRQKELQEFAQEAVEISVDALRAMFKKRPDLLALTSSEERSIEIMHGGRSKRQPPALGSKNE